MKLKKINQELESILHAQGFEVATLLQKKSFGTIKSGVDTFLCGPRTEGKSLSIVLSVLQRLESVKEEDIATQALIVVQDKDAVLELIALFESLNAPFGLRIYGVHERTDLDQDKNMLSLGNDILIGTPERLNEMLSAAGFDVNQLKLFIIDDLDTILRMRLEPRLFRLSQSIGKTQRLFTATAFDERVDVFIDKTMNEDVSIFDFSMEEEEE